MALRTTTPKVALIAGLHRSGTTLISRLLNSLPDVVALNEPMKVKNLQNLPDTDLFVAIEEFLSSTRSGLVSSHQAISRHTDGYATDNYFPGTMAENGLRKSVEKDGLVTFDKVLSDDFLLVIKHNSAFTAYLDRLFPRYSCYGIIRNPLALLSSWQTVDMPVNRGHIPVAEAIDPDLHKKLSFNDDILERQIIILNWFFDQYNRCLLPDRIIRYEDVIASGGNCLSIIAPAAQTRIAQEIK